MVEHSPKVLTSEEKSITPPNSPSPFSPSFLTKFIVRIKIYVFSDSFNQNHLNSCNMWSQRAARQHLISPNALRPIPPTPTPTLNLGTGVH